MTPEILAYLRNESPDFTPTLLQSVVHHWRDRLQAEDARAVLTDDLPLEASTATDEQVTVALTAWCATVRDAWFAYAGAADKDALQTAVADALAGDRLLGWAGAHDALGACGRASADFGLGRDTCASCYSALRLGRYETREVQGLDGPTNVTELVGYDETVAALQASFRAVLAGLCAGA